MHKKFQHTYSIIKHRVITMLNRKEMDFLDKLGKDALFSTGHKLSYNEILRGLLHFAIEIGLSGEGITSFRVVKEKVLEAIKKAQPGNEFPKPFEILTAEQEHPKEQSLKPKDNQHG